MGLPIVLVVLCACGGGNGKGKTAGEMPEPVALEGDSLAVRQILAPQQMTVKGEVALIMSPRTDTVFYAFGLPDFRFLYRQGVQGNGPDDFLWQNICAYPSDSVFALDEMGKDRLGLYRIGTEGFSRLRAIKSKENGFSTVVDDSIAVAAEYYWGGQERALLGPKLYVYNLSGGERTDSIPLQTYKNNVRLGQLTNSLVNGFLCIGYGSRLAVAYSLMDRIEFYEITPGGKAVLRRAVGKDERLNPALENYAKEHRSFDQAQNFENAPLYYMFSGYATENYLFVRNFSGMTPLEWQRAEQEGTFGLSLDVYTWDGEPVARLRLPQDGIFAVSEKYKTIYLIDPEKDFEYVYTFRYDF